MPKCNLIFSGLSLSSEQRHAIDAIILTLQSKSPSDCIIYLQVVSGECVVKGFLKIRSNLMNFEISEDGYDPVEVVKLLSKQWKSEISNWKRDIVI